jgi:hypothetical protein
MSRTRPTPPITPTTPESDLMLMHSLAGIRAAGYSIMLVMLGSGRRIASGSVNPAVRSAMWPFSST